jgi:hypothetical protein
MLFMKGEKLFCGSFKTRNHKKLGPQIANPQKCHISTEGPQIQQICQ